MARLDQFIKIAVHCSKYTFDKSDIGSLKNISLDKYERCTNCSHFTHEYTCELNLINKALFSLDMEAEFKS